MALVLLVGGHRCCRELVVLVGGEGVALHCRCGVGEEGVASCHWRESGVHNSRLHRELLLSIVDGEGLRGVG